MNILHKFKETAVSVLPVMAIVFLLGFTIVPLEPSLLLKFFISGILLIVGLTIFLLGVDLGIQPMGERSGAELTKRKNLSFLLITAFVIGFIVTIAEPDIQVFADQVRGVFPSVKKLTFTYIIAGGVGLFIMLGLLRIVTNLSLKWTLFICYTILFGLIFFAQDSFTAIAFDSGGATTGPMTVPFIMALGLGVSSVRAGKQDNSFGLTGISSIGPVLAVVVYAIVMRPSTGSGAPLTAADPELVEGLEGATNIVRQVIHESLTSILPLFVMFVVFQFLLLKMTARQVFRMLIGFVYSFVGLAVFLGGVYGGFMQTGKLLGQAFGALAFERGGIWTFLLILTGLLLGAIIVCAEPAVWCLSEQVETVSGGTIKRKMLLVFLSVGTAVAIGLAMWRAIAGFNIKWLLIPGYAVSMLLMLFCPELFTGIAFDSGGVASGPLTSTFVLSFALGAANSASGSSDSFGVIALVAMMPLIAIQIMGIIYKIKTSKNNKGGQGV
ncbi:MAG: DUF1538 domain-containing protein [Treponema sp.]|nr:DUF1538 domain-containing protein [Treponema sp.]